MDIFAPLKYRQPAATGDYAKSTDSVGSLAWQAPSGGGGGGGTPPPVPTMLFHDHTISQDTWADPGQRISIGGYVPNLALADSGVVMAMESANPDDMLASNPKVSWTIITQEETFQLLVVNLGQERVTLYIGTVLKFVFFKPFTAYPPFP